MVDDVADTIVSMQVILDEGQDVVPDEFFGVAILDNIDVNGTLVGDGPTNAG